MTLHPAKTQISLGICQVWSVSSLSAWRKLGSLATHWAHSEDWSDWADAQADLSLCWEHMPFCWFCHVVAQLPVHELHQKRTCVSGVCDQARLKHACFASEAAQWLDFVFTTTEFTIRLSKERTIKALISLCGWAGWSAPVLFAYCVRQVFLWQGSHVYGHCFKIFYTEKKLSAI